MGVLRSFEEVPIGTLFVEVTVNCEPVGFTPGSRGDYFTPPDPPDIDDFTWDIEEVYLTDEEGNLLERDLTTEEDKALRAELDKLLDNEEGLHWELVELAATYREEARHDY